MAWPEVVPILSANDIHQGGMDGNRGSKCIAAWFQDVFCECRGQERENAPNESRQAEKALLREIGSSGRNRPRAWNDSTPRRIVAATWNRFVRSLGYTEPCDYEG